MKRRSAIRAAGTSVLFAAAGCLGNGDDSGSETNGQEEDEPDTDESDGGDSPSVADSAWRTFQGDTENTGTGSSATGPAPEPSLDWKFTTDDELWGDPVVVDGTVLTTSWDDTLYAVSLDSGTEQWAYEGGSCSAPVAVGLGTVYLAADGVTALDLSSGTTYWTADVNVHTDGGPVLADGILYVPAKDYLVALSVTTGEQLWTVRTAGPVAATPHVTEDSVYFTSTDDNIYAATTGGELRWQQRISRQGGQPSPTVVDGTVYFGWGDGVMYALDAEDGTELWTDNAGGSETVAVSDGVVYIASYPLRAIDTESQEVLWTTEEPAGIPTNFTVGTDRVYLGSDEAQVFAYDRETGEQVWQYQDNYEVVSSPAIADDRLVYGDEFGNLICLS